MQGILLIDKPVGWTSFDVVNYVRKMVAQVEGKRPKQIKVGHTGTLDPFATGLLVLLVGKDYTRRAGEFSKLDKTYEVTMKLGETSSTGDPEGEITPYAPEFRHSELAEESRKPESGAMGSLDFARDDRGVLNTAPSRKALLEALKSFRGHIEQVPPAYSAIKINGQRAYKLARADKEVKIEPRKVTINTLELVDYSYPEVKLIADVSSGTYIRSLVEDIGKALSTGAHTTTLRRTKVGPFDLSGACDAKTLTATSIYENTLTSSFI